MCYELIAETTITTVTATIITRADIIAITTTKVLRIQRRISGDHFITTTVVLVVRDAEKMILY